jgi:DNA-binding SARP family transcriptional activator
MQFRVLGTLEVLDDEGGTIDVGGAHQRTVLARLLVAAGRPVPAASLIDDLWGGQPPPSAAGTLQSYVSRLRRALERAGGGASLVREQGGYRLAADADDIDVRRFERLADAGREQLAAGDAALARATLGDALRLWRGPALAEWAELDWAIGLAARLDERRLAAIEDRVRADLQLGRHEDAVAELGELVVAHPYREGLAVSLATALYRCGRQAEALRAIADLRERLRDDLGLDPGPPVTEVEVQILNHDPSLLPAAPPSGPTVVARSHAAHVGGLETNRIVGREAEQAAVEDALAAALAGRTRWLLLEGDPGIGKSRLVEHLADRAATAGVDVLWARSLEMGGTPAFWLWLGPLRSLVATSEPLPDAGLHRLIAGLIDPAPDDDVQAVSAANDPRRLRMFEAVSVLLEQAASTRPRLIILDDVHWADPASLELMTYLAHLAFAAPLMVAITARPFDGGEPVTEALATIARRPHTTLVRLRGVDPADCAEMIEQATGHRPSPEVAAAVFTRAEGNPFFIRELGRLLDADAGLGDADLVRRAGIPAGVRDVLRRRLKGLDGRTTALLQIAAAFGRQVSLPLLARAAQLGIDECAEGLEPALASGLLKEVPESFAAIRFEHALVQEVLLADMSMVARARVHLRVADAIEATGGAAADDAEIVAAHLWQAAAVVPGDRVPRALERAAEVAARRMALETAADLLERSLRLREAMPLGEVEVDAETELAVIRRATALRRALSGYARAGERIERAKQLARHSGSYDVLAELLWTEWAAAATVCEAPAALRLARELGEVAAASGDSALIGVSLGVSGVTQFQFGDLGDACRDLDRAVAMRGAAGAEAPPGDGAPPWLAEPDLVTVCFQALAHQLAGVADAALSSLRPIAEALPDPYARAVVWVFEGLRACLASDFDAAWLAAKSALEEATDGSFALYEPGARGVLGQVQIATGSVADGIANCERSLAGYAAIGTRTFVPWIASRTALGCLELGDVEAARRWLDRARSILDASGERWQQPALDTVAAKIAAAEGADPAAVGAAFDAALARAREAGALGLALRLAADR